MLIQRNTFLTLSSCVALGVGVLAVLFPRLLLESKGVALPNGGAEVWVREVGVILLALGLILLLVRRQPASATLRAILFGNALLHLGLFPIELAAYRDGVLTRLPGIVPNSLLHLVLAVGFLTFAARMREPATRAP